MHALPNNIHFDTLTLGQKIFLEAWFNLTHQRSLDSYRVRCHNGRTILEELWTEMQHPFAGNEDLATIAAEALETCESDIVAVSELGISWPIAKPLLVALANDKPDKPEPQKNALSQLKLVLIDALPKFPKAYLRSTIKSLESAIAQNESLEIIRLSNCLATELVARNLSVESLHSWVETVFLSDAWSGKAFNERFDFFAQRVQQSPHSYNVIISLSGSSELQKLDHFCGFQFSAAAPVVDVEPGDTKSLAKFLRTNGQKTFATTTVDAVDQFSAAHIALQKFARCQDRLRFNFSPEPVRGRKPVLVTRNHDQKHKIVPIVFGIPNPEHLLSLTAFLSANKRLEDLFESKQIDESSAHRLESAVRHYRLGLDGFTYHDMFLNWWMGFETLTNSGDGKGGIGGKVIGNAAPLLTYRYLGMQIRHLSAAVRSVCGNWTEEVTALLSVSQNQPLNWGQVVAVLQNPAAASSISAKLATRPWLAHRWQKFQTLFENAATLADYLAQHEQRLRWHLNRLYRIRCCLVHGTPIVAPLQLPAANLEYYLRESIQVVIGAITKSTQIDSLENLFQRARFCSSRRKSMLTGKPNPATVIKDYLNTNFILAN